MAGLSADHTFTYHVKDMFLVTKVYFSNQAYQHVLTFVGKHGTKWM